MKHRATGMEISYEGARAGAPAILRVSMDPMSHWTDIETRRSELAFASWLRKAADMIEARAAK